MGDILAAGTLVAQRFEIQHLAGSGGMATVFRALDRETGSPVALKLLHTGRLQLHEQDRFEREAQLLAGLRHPRIVSYVAHGYSADGLRYLAMEWLDGEDLAMRLDHHGLSVHESLRVVRYIAEALAPAHRRGIVHRDLKPSNVYLRGGTIEGLTLLDFGIARPAAGGGTRERTRTGVIVGTPEYMAPEQARGQRDLKASADIFSLGCILFECLVGTAPFVGEHIAALLAKILFEDPPPLRNLRPELPQLLEELLGRMLAKAPETRPQDADALLAELTQLDGLPEHDAPVTSRAPGSHPWADSERLLLTAILAVPPPASSGQTATLELSPDQARGNRLAQLRAALLPYRCQLESLADGSLAGTLPPSAATAAEQAMHAARCALLVKEHLPDAAVALTTGRGVLREPLLGGGVLDCAARLVDEVFGDREPAPPELQRCVVTDAATARLLEEMFEVSRIGTNSFALHGERTSLDDSRLLLGQPTPCVGREQELALLELMLHGCIEEPRASAMLIVAAPGLGKSRLRHEFLRRLQGRGTSVELMIGRGDPIAAGYGLVGQAVRVLCGIAPGAELPTQRARLAERVGRHLPPESSQSTIDFLGELCGVPFEDGSSPALQAARRDPALMHEQITASFLAFLRAECTARPVLLVLEDLHWGDRLTVRLFDEALRQLADQPFMLLALARPEAKELFPKLWEGRNYQELSLGAINRKAAEQLARKVLGARLGDATLVRIVDQAGGNALFLEELIRAVADGKSDALPDTVLVMLQARLMRLEPQVRRVLRAASVYGETFSSAGVAALLSTSASGEGLESWLRQLVQAEVIEGQRAGQPTGETTYRFRHALMRDAAYVMLTDEDRLLGHRLAAEFLESTGEQDAMVLAEHHERGGQPAAAGRHYQRAARTAFWHGDTDAAMVRAQRGLRCSQEDEVRIELLAVLTDIHGWRGEWAEGGRYAEQVIALARPGTQPWAGAMATKSVDALMRGQLEGAVTATLLQLCDVEPEPQELPGMAFGMMAVSHTFELACRFELVERIHRCMDALIGDAADPVSRAWQGVARSLHGCLTGAPERGLHAARVVADCFGAVVVRRGVILAEILTGLNLSLLGQLEAAEAKLRATLAAGGEFGPVSSHRTAWLAQLCKDRGALAEARRIAEECIEHGARRGFVMDEGLGRWALADVLLALGDLGAAEQQARRAVEQLARIPADELPARATLAAILFAQGRAAEACSTAAAVIERYEAIAALAYKESFARLVHAEALAAAGEHAAARSALAAARRQLVARSELIVDPALRHGFLQHVPEHARILELAG